MAEYIKREDAIKKARFLLICFGDIYVYSNKDLADEAQRGMETIPSIDIDNYIPIKYIQDFCKDCADEGIGTVSTYMEDAGEAIVKSWFAVKDTDFGKKYKR